MNSHMLELIDTKKSKDLGIWVHERTNNTALPNEQKICVGMALLQHAVDLVDGSILLLDNNLPGVALTLARPIFEAYVRGIWSLHCANKDELDHFQKKGQPPQWHLSKLIKTIKRCKLDQSTWVCRINRESKELNDLVHGGSLHLMGHIGEGVIEPAYPEKQLRWLLNEGDEVRVRVAYEHFDLACDVEAMEKLSKYLELHFNRTLLESATN